MVMHKATKIANPKGRYLADPFVYSREGKDYCFVEDFNVSKAHGSISVFDLTNDEASFIGYALCEPFHLSFPYLFEYNEQLYMVPETSQNADIRIYRCIDFPLKWELAGVAMKNVSAADSMIFKRGDLWWLFTNINPMGGRDHSSELMIFYADDPLSSEWRPHEENPVYIDPSVARNGGLLYDNDRVFRTAQVTGFSQYGAKSKLFEIRKLTPNEFEETLVSEIEPDFFDGLLGTHHLHSNGTITAFDFVWRQKV
jgi:hypothetical protein